MGEGKGQRKGNRWRERRKEKNKQEQNSEERQKGKRLARLEKGKDLKSRNVHDISGTYSR